MKHDELKRGRARHATASDLLVRVAFGHQTCDFLLSQREELNSCRRNVASLRDVKGWCGIESLWCGSWCGIIPATSTSSPTSLIAQPRRSVVSATTCAGKGDLMSDSVTVSDSSGKSVPVKAGAGSNLVPSVRFTCSDVASLLPSPR
jgi:hypothetical protein